MDKYIITIHKHAYRDLDSIYNYISENLSEDSTALNIIDELEKAILSLEQFPMRGAVRRIGAYADKDYRQLFVKNYAIIYRVFDDKKEVHIITVKYAPSNF